MKRAMFISGATVITAVSVTFLFLSAKSFSLQFSETQLRQQLAQRLPLEKTYFMIFKVTLENPRISLENGDNRVHAGLDTTLQIALRDQPTLGGTVDFSAGIRYQPEGGTFFLVDPIIEEMNLSGVPKEYAERANTVMAQAISDYYSSHPIYTLKPTDVKQATARLVLRDVQVERHHLIVTLGL